MTKRTSHTFLKLASFCFVATVMSACASNPADSRYGDSVVVPPAPCGVTMQPCGYVTELYAIPSVTYKQQTICQTADCLPPAPPPPPVVTVPEPMPEPEPPVYVPPAPEPPVYIPPAPEPEPPVYMPPPPISCPPGEIPGYNGGPCVPIAIPRK
ncbi:hypothetical protein ACJ3XI_06730 [Litorimonas sp. RW-G-Af-16]|uniref:hypothetical protein n=2 Tax=Litorimonas sp. RW-G-Af-16 TaxID=3241168 RepID=UPI00390C7A42